MLVDMLDELFTVTYSAPVGSSVDHYLKGIYVGSRPSLFKDWEVYHCQETHRDMVKFRFPRWWKKKIEAVQGISNAS